MVNVISLLCPGFVFMKKIIVNSPKHGIKEILVDNDMFEDLNKFTWCAHKCGNVFYAMRKYKRTISIMMHRLVMGITDPNIMVDHRDNNGLNNQRSNLRTATRSENLCNRKSVRNSKSKYKGVAWVTSHKLWRASIQKDKVQRALGYFKSEIDAAKAYDAAAKQYHGEFANLNFK